MALSAYGRSGRDPVAFEGSGWDIPFIAPRNFRGLDRAFLGVGWDIENGLRHAKNLKTHIALD